MLIKRERDRVFASKDSVSGSEKPTETGDKIVIVSENHESDNENPHSKEEESRVKESKVNIYPYQDIVELWNSTCSNFPKVLKLTDARKNKIRVRLDEFGQDLESKLSTVETLFKKTQASKYMRGDNKSGWQATFDWVFENSKNWVKILEGNYDNKGEVTVTGQVKLGYDERIESGRRTYGTGKVTIPMDAPPRPNGQYAWNESTQQWIIL